jgi:hypothetical protein
MKPLAVLAAALATTLLLAGCTPDTDAAYKRCYNAYYSALDVSGLTVEQVVDIQVKVADLCAGDAKADPDAFNAKWSG